MCADPSVTRIGGVWQIVLHHLCCAGLFAYALMHFEEWEKIVNSITVSVVELNSSLRMVRPYVQSTPLAPHVNGLEIATWYVGRLVCFATTSYVAMRHHWAYSAMMAALYLLQIWWTAQRIRKNLSKRHKLKREKGGEEDGAGVTTGEDIKAQ